MEIADSDFGKIIIGRVIKLKKGSGSAENKLTIVTLDSLNNGTTEKMLCWNSDYEDGFKLSDNARRLSEGNLVTARVEYDVGDPNKSVCYEMKKTGLYRLLQDGKKIYSIAGYVAKATANNSFYSIWIPAYVYQQDKIVTAWYRVCFWHLSKEKASGIKKGDYVVIRCSNLRSCEYNGMSYFELSGYNFFRLKEKGRK